MSNSSLSQQRGLCRHWRVLAVIGTVILLAGCGLLASEAPELPDGDTAVQQYEDLDAYSATVVTEFTHGNETNVTEGTIVARPGTGQYYQEIRPTGQDGGITMISNGTVTWLYDEAENEVTRLSTGPGIDYERDQIRRTINRAQEDDETVPMVPSAPVAPTAGGETGDATLDLGPATVEYEGVEHVGDREAHVISMDAADEADGEYTQTLYLDTEWFVQLRMEMRTTLDDEPVEMSYRVEDVDFDPDIDDDRFEFEPPADATIEEPADIDRTVYDSRADLVADVEMSVPDPDLPDGFELRQAEHSIGLGFESVSLQYTSDVALIGVTKQNTTFDPADDDAETVEIGDQIGTYDQIGSDAIVSWDCDGDAYSVSGDIDREELVAIAESVECD